MGSRSVTTDVETWRARTPNVARVWGGLGCCLVVTLIARGADMPGLPTGADTRRSPPIAAAATKPAVVGIALGRESERYIRALRGEVNESPVQIGVVDRRASRRLVEGYRLAVDRLRARESCRDLFAELGADGLGVLSRTIYLQPRVRWECEVCEAGAPAFTFVGAVQTRVCSGFGDLSRSAAAMTLIHEALHHAGLDERPHDPESLSPHQINRMVARSCGL